MNLTRRDALAALAGIGVTAGSVAVGRAPRDGSPLAEHDRETSVALARVLYPSAVGGVGPFVETYLDGLAADRPAHAASVSEAVADLDAFCRPWWGRPFAELPADHRERAPAEMGLATTRPDPDGVARERVRYYLVDELLYTLYGSPTGGRLLGIENPPGYPGGLESYQRGEARE